MNTGKEQDPVLNDTKPQHAKPANARPSGSESEGNRTPAIAGLVIAVVLLAVGLWLARALTAASKMQDCVMSGRTNCNVIELQ
ncbi:hypothetical protein [Bradyrhizobium sp.]|uniref:hypothetical protein n=1 Tax=Bradyrhizobium sp. TaxID=376 RepID=UPI002623B15C|nr:hypothetical protein [Bradyrhizobium sp.]